jgi:tRNA A37 threonylcarbamoyladenosine modification protein TsaB
MTILLIDTSKPTVWVGLVHDSKVVAEKEWLGDKTIGVKLLEGIEELTQDGRPQRIAVHVGPGHFMALRTGVVTAQLLAQTWGVELVEIGGNERAELIQEAAQGVPVAAITVQY